MADAGDIISAVVSACALGGMYWWGKSKGYEKSNFENEDKNNKSEIEMLREEIAKMKAAMASTNNKGNQDESTSTG